MGARPADAPFDPRTAALIKQKAKQLVGRYGFTRDDEPDLRQELSMHVFQGLKRHDPARGSACTFAARIIESKVASIVRKANAAKRDPRRCGSGVNVEELQARDSEEAERRELSDAVQVALAGLRPQTRAVATLLMKHGQSEVARRLGLSRQQVRTECQRIAEHLREMGRKKLSRRQPRSLDALFQRDLILLRNDVSERAITHKLAEHIQRLVGDLDVDCEYNRNVALGEFSPKYLQLAVGERREAIGDRLVREVPEEVLKAYSTFPDVVVHRRGTNDANTLVIEVKKKNSPIRDTFDLEKLRAFTEGGERNGYHYEHGVFICLETGVHAPSAPVLRWFTGGREDRVSQRR